MDIFLYISFPTTTEIALEDYMPVNESPVPTIMDTPPLRAIAANAESFSIDVSGDVEMSSSQICAAPGRLAITGSVYRDNITSFIDIPFSALRSLTIRGECSHVTAGEWQQVFKRLPALTHLELDVDELTTSTVLISLAKNTRASRGLWTSLVLSEHIVFSRPSVVFQMLLTLLKLRARAGNALTSCELVGHFWDRDDVRLEELRQLVGTVTVRRRDPLAEADVEAYSDDDF